MSQANARCTEALVRIAGATSPGAELSPESIAGFADGYGSLYANLRRLPIPPGDEQVVGRFLDSLRVGVDHLRSAQRQSGGELAGYVDVQQGLLAVAEFTAAAESYGVTDCGG